jgi:cardiolipin synthase (CMP-forming)
VTRADIPNLISVARIFLVLPTVMALLNEQFVLALLLYTIAGISDGLDGYIAKRYHYISRLGSILDPLADKLLLVATYIALAWLELLPVWLAAAVVARDLLILLGASLYHLLIGKYEMEPTLISKLNTVAQIMLGLLTVFAAGIYALPEQFMDWLVFFVFGTTVLSGLDYMWIWGKRAWRARAESSS